MSFLNGVTSPNELIKIEKLAPPHFLICLCEALWRKQKQTNKQTNKMINILFESKLNWFDVAKLTKTD